MPPVEGTVVDEALEEVSAAILALEPVLEGLYDYSRLNIQPETLTIIQNTIAEHERRKALLTAAELGMTQLLEDGYPLLPVHEVNQLVYEDLAAQEESISAALAHFQQATAASLGLEPGAVEPKP